MMEALDSSETSARTRAVRRNIPENDTLHIHRHEILKSYIVYNNILRIFETHCDSKKEEIRHH
jgi:hypothetical protein